MALPQNKNVAQPDLRALLELMKQEIYLQMNCHAIGTVQGFDAAAQTVQVTINYQKTYFRGANLNEPTYVAYPVLVDCPIVILTGGAGRLTFPIAVGDTCLVLFNDRDMDNWFSSGQILPVKTQRMHSFSDAIALVGIRSLKNVLEDYDEERVSLEHGTTRVAVGAEKVLVENEATTLLEVLNGLIDVIKGLSTTNAVVGAPCALSPATIAQLESYKTTIGGLLE